MSYRHDPYTQIERALYVAFEQTPEIASGVRIGNRIRPDSRNPHAKTNTMEADLPELVIRCIGGESDPANSSNASTEIRRFRVSIATGTPNSQADNGVNALEWQIKRSVWEKRDLLRGWCPFVTMVRTQGVNREISLAGDEATNRTHEGWIAVIDVLITCVWPDNLEILV